MRWRTPSASLGYCGALISEEADYVSAMRGPVYRPPETRLRWLSTFQIARQNKVNARGRIKRSVSLPRTPLADNAPAKLFKLLFFFMNSRLPSSRFLQV